ALQLREIEQAARVLNVELQPVEVRAAEAFEAAVRAVVGQGTQALIVVPGLLFTEQRHRLAELAVQHRLPTMWYRREQVEAGGLMSYGTNFSAMYRRGGAQRGKPLKRGKKAGPPPTKPHKSRAGVNPKNTPAPPTNTPPTHPFP